MLSSPCWPFGQPTALSVPHDALRTFAWLLAITFGDDATGA